MSSLGVVELRPDTPGPLDSRGRLSPHVLLCGIFSSLLILFSSSHLPFFSSILSGFFSSFLFCLSSCRVYGKTLIVGRLGTPYVLDGCERQFPSEVHFCCRR